MKKNSHITCPFCSPIESQIAGRDTHFYFYRDHFPLSPGHTLIIPFRHVETLRELNGKESSSLLMSVLSAQKELDEAHRPDGYNIGINQGPAGGQTVPHLHIHLIPRYTGDQPDPRGGIRWIFPEKADYWS